MEAEEGNVKDILGANKITGVVNVKSMNNKTTVHGGGKQGKRPPGAKGHVKFEQIVMLV